MEDEQLLKQDLVLSQEKIAGVQKYLLKKYPEASPKKRAALLSQTLHQMIARSLPDFEEAENARLTLFEKMITSGEMKLSKYDLVEVSVDHISKARLVEWMEQQDIDTRLADRFYPEEADVLHESTDDKTRTIKKPFLLSTAIFAAVFLLLYTSLINKNTDSVSDPVNRDYIQVEPVYNGPANELPEDMQFTIIDQDALTLWLSERNSLLAEEQYFTAIYEAAYDFNIHPYLLFAITGQEQGFVSKDHPEAEEIANNPFNVFHSWEDFNSTIEESSEIAARTVVNLSEGRPDGHDPIRWINRKYAEDPNWWKGVRAIFDQIENEVPVDK
ncbi:hypothetical protein [Jeotgalibacillus salarius]|uniref:Uncharacterized protein n=1 Tax=Jeotgalibacillus salarius TaxID=546023 RepID=A0A4Y8LLV0_9BACL|nr:hypothetical protein [Jeotgalibacillus salarius]TFE02227.1 hypothetical protein E2626_06515 [Jeotgalibacillus salarius]